MPTQKNGLPPRRSSPSEIVASGFHRNGTGPNPSSFGATSSVMFTGGGAGGVTTGTASTFTSHTSSMRGAFPPHTSNFTETAFAPSTRRAGTRTVWTWRVQFVAPLNGTYSAKSCPALFLTGSYRPLALRRSSRQRKAPSAPRYAKDTSNRRAAPIAAGFREMICVAPGPRSFSRRAYAFVPSCSKEMRPGPPP